MALRRCFMRWLRFVVVARACATLCCMVASVMLAAPLKLHAALLAIMQNAGSHVFMLAQPDCDWLRRAEEVEILSPKKSVRVYFCESTSTASSSRCAASAVRAMVKKSQSILKFKSTKAGHAFELVIATRERTICLSATFVD